LKLWEGTLFIHLFIYIAYIIYLFIYLFILPPRKYHAGDEVGAHRGNFFLEILKIKLRRAAFEVSAGGLVVVYLSLQTTLKMCQSSLHLVDITKHMESHSKSIY
jgi:hypothetical protein